DTHTTFSIQAEHGIRDHLVTGVQTCALPICQVSSVAISADGKRIVSGSGDQAIFGARPFSGEVKVWDTQKGKEVLSLKGHPGGRSEERRVGRGCRCGRWWAR